MQQAVRQLPYKINHRELCPVEIDSLVTVVRYLRNEQPGVHAKESARNTGRIPFVQNGVVNGDVYQYPYVAYPLAFLADDDTQRTLCKMDEEHGEASPSGKYIRYYSAVFWIDTERQLAFSSISRPRLRYEKNGLEVMTGEETMADNTHNFAEVVIKSYDTEQRLLCVLNAIHDKKIL